MPNPRYLLVSDTTLTHDYRNFPLLDFLPSAPFQAVPRPFYSFLKGKVPSPLADGQASIAPYSVRKMESALLKELKEEEVAVPHEDYIERFVTPETEVIGVSTMDPLGLGPLTMSYAVLFGRPDFTPWVRREFEELMARISRAKARVNSKAKVLVGGPGVWEFTVMPEELDRLGIDCAFQGEADDIACELFDSAREGFTSGAREESPFFAGFQTFDPGFHKSWVGHGRFLTRAKFSNQSPTLDEIPEIRRPAAKAITEVMRGCGIGCDFCEVTLRPLRYYPYDKVQREIEVNAKQGGFPNAWLHTDEVFAYEHGRNYEPNFEALTGLFSAVMSVRGIEKTNPTHGRISIPAAHPELLRSLSRIARAGPSNWIGVQVGIETGSERLAKLHMPNKTLPLKVGADGSWPEIVWRGTYTLNKYYWRPAFTVQVGQSGETDEDNWDTVALVNMMSNSSLDGGRPFEFTVTPMQNVPLGMIKGRRFSIGMLKESQLAVYYACYRHLAKMALRDAAKDSEGGALGRLATTALLSLGGETLLHAISTVCRRKGLDLERASRHGAGERVRSQISLEAPAS
ncbi:MAG: B12-binding domain-containing radical SAM protein [Nitrososphaerota archaeon]|nr:B12-binding domain-containing radical SAM protein [Nitrososphaerota archaeon]